MGFVRLYIPAAAIAFSVLSTDARAIELDIDYSQDTSGFFTTNPLAKAAMEAAAKDLSDAILTPLGATVDTNEASVGIGSASFNFDYNYTHPSNGSPQTFNPAVLPEDTVKIFVGAQSLGGGTLGMGGPGGMGVVVGFAADAAPPQQQIDDINASWNQARTDATANVRRGGGPVIGNLSGTIGSGEINLDYDLDFGVGIGNLWFDNNTNWHFDHTTTVAFDAFDFYSVALHELLHAVGIGAADSWDDLVSGSDSRDWLGGAVAAILGSGDNVLESDSNHIAAGTLGTSIVTGLTQEVSMDPDITNGTRKYLTDVDLAFLSDIGWTVVPEPSSMVLLVGATALLIGRRRAA